MRSEPQAPTLTRYKSHEKMPSHNSEDPKDEQVVEADPECTAYDNLIEDLFMTPPEDTPKEE